MGHPEEEKKYYSYQEYLTMEDANDYKSEFLDGKIFSMAGGTVRHSAIATNTIIAMGNTLKGKPCRPFNSDLKVMTDHHRNYMYPDITVVCGQIEYAALRNDTIINPSVIVEVLSPSTEKFDRNEKFSRYRTLTSLKEYILISQTKPMVETYLRSGDKWIYQAIEDIEAILSLESLNIELSLKDIYKNVEFDILPTYEN